MADHLMYSDPAPDNASDESSVNFSPREGPGIVLDAPRHRNTTNTCQPEQTDLKPSFTHPHGSAQVINLRNRPGKYGKTGTRSHKNARPKVPNGKYSVSMAQMESYFRTELGWTLIKRMTDNTSASNGFQERNADFSVGFQTDERGEIPIDPVLLEYDRQVQLNLINPGNKDYCSDSPTLPPSRVHGEAHTDNLNDVWNALKVYPSSGAALHTLSSSESTVRFLPSSTPLRKPAANIEPSSSSSEQIQYEFNPASQYGVTVSYPHNEYNNSHRAPVSQSQVNRSHADHEPDSTVFDIPSSPGVRLPLKRESVDESTKALADEFLNLDDTNSYSDEEAAFLGEECGPKIRTYRPYPAISAKEHGILNAPYGNRHTNPNHLERALERANQFPIVWRPRAQSHILLCEGRSIENYPIAIHAAKKVKFLSSLVREVKWKPGVDFEAAQSTNKVISKEAGDLKKLFPTVYDDFHAPDKGFFEGIIEDIVLAEE